MKRCLLGLFAIFVGAVILPASSRRAIGDETHLIRTTVDASKSSAPISKYVYGQFIEHIGGIINTGLWAEMLDDRKFYYPIKSQSTTDDAPAGRGRRFVLRRWTPVGPDDSVVMDTQRPYVGEHSPLVKLSGSEPHGMRQKGLAVLKDQLYRGRIVIAGEPDADVTVNLIVGEAGDENRQSVSIGKLGREYVTIPFEFRALADSTDAQLEIEGKGSGTFEVGTVSLMPADNLEGFRAEIISTLKQLHSGIYRFPGGNFVSGHEWRDAIGERDKRPPRMDYVWNAVQPNDVGTDEFMALCRLLEVEPYITVNAGFGDAWSAAQYVEYANGAVTTPMGKQRAANGHPEPYGVKFWGIGNEAWGDWQFGAMSLRQFEIKHNMFAKAMRLADPTIQLIGSGAMPDAMTGSKQSLRISGKLIPEYLSAADWTGGLFSHCLENMDLVSEHFYSYNNQRFDLEKGNRVPTAADEPSVEWMRRPANHVRAKYEAYQDYLELIPALKTKPVPINLDEWAYSGVTPNSYKVVPAYAWVFHEMFRHSYLFQMAGFTFATSLVSADRNHAVLNPTGLLFKMYRDHYGTIPVGVNGNSPQPKPKYPAGGEEPKVNAGSDTFPLDVAAAWTSDRKALTIAVINPTEAEQRLSLTIKGTDLTGSGRLWRMAPEKIDAVILVGQKPGVEVEELKLDVVAAEQSFAPFSVTIYELPVR